jgi:hypothetical protein
LERGGNEETSGFFDERQKGWMSDTANTVCPIGWYVPSYDELKKATDAEGINNAQSALDSVFKLALTGSKSSNGTLESQGSEGYLWTTDKTTLANTNFAFTYNSLGTLWSRPYRSTGYSIRCIKK